MRFDDQNNTIRAPKTMNSMCDDDRGRYRNAERSAGAGSSTIGSITMKAAPRNEPRIEPSPPMMTMNSTWNERSMSKASGSQEPS